MHSSISLFLMTDVKVFGAGFMDKTLMRGAVSIKNGALTRVRFLVSFVLQYLVCYWVYWVENSIRKAWEAEAKTKNRLKKKISIDRKLDTDQDRIILPSPQLCYLVTFVHSKANVYFYVDGKRQTLLLYYPQNMQNLKCRKTVL